MLEIASARELTEDEQAFYDYLSSMQKDIYEFYSPATWNNLKVNSIFNTNGIEVTKDKLIEMAKAGTLSEETIKGYANLNKALENSKLILQDGETAASAFVNEIYSLANNLNSSFTTLASYLSDNKELAKSLLQNPLRKEIIYNG